MSIMKKIMMLETEKMMNDVICKFGLEARETILFCRNIENDININWLRTLYNSLMLK